jgi:uncharacterized membrane protein YgcG
MLTRLSLFFLIIILLHPFYTQGKGYESKYVYDYADVLSYSERAHLEDELSHFHKKNKYNVFIVLTRDSLIKAIDSLPLLNLNAESEYEKVIIFADVNLQKFDLKGSEALMQKFSPSLIEKIKNENLRKNFQSKKYYRGLSDASKSVFGIITGKISEDSKGSDSSSAALLLLILIVVFFIIVFPLIQFISMKKSHFSSKKLDLVSTVLLTNTFGTRGKNMFDDFSSGRGSFASKNNKVNGGGAGVQGVW